MWSTPNIDATNCIVKLDYLGFISDTSDLVFEIEYFDSASAVNEVSSNLFQLNPNPTKGIVFIANKHGNKTTPNYVKVYSLEGKLLETLNYNNTLDLSYFNNGVYLIQIVDLIGRVHPFQKLVISK